MIISLTIPLVLICLLLTLIVYQSITIPIGKVVSVYSSGHQTAARVRDPSPDELGFLARTIDDLADRNQQMLEQISADDRRKRELELERRVEEYHGSLSRSWLQQAHVYVDVLPHTLRLPRHYAFRYLNLEVMGMSHRFRLKIRKVSCTAQTAADEGKLKPYQGPEAYARLDRIACRTLRDCMHEVFEDGPKRDRRLWMGDLRLQALVTYETYGDMELVKKCLYYFAAAANEEGGIPGCLFTEPKVEADGTMMFDYSLLFLPTLLDYYKASSDRQTL